MLSGVNAQGEVPHALRFCEAVLESGHQLACIFFSGDSVSLATTKQQCEGRLLPWQAIAEKAGVELSLCSNSASAFALRPDNLPKHCVIAGLGYWLDQDSQAQRSLRFAS